MHVKPNELPNLDDMKLSNVFFISFTHITRHRFGNGLSWNN